MSFSTSLPVRYFCPVFRVKVGPRFVHLLNHLEGQHDIADLAALAVPDQLHFALFLEQQKAVFVRQRLVRLQIANDLLLFLFSQSWHEVPLTIQRQSLSNRAGRRLSTSSFLRPCEREQS